VSDQSVQPIIIMHQLNLPPSCLLPKDNENCLFEHFEILDLTENDEHGKKFDLVDEDVFRPLQEARGDVGGDSDNLYVNGGEAAADGSEAAHGGVDCRGGSDCYWCKDCSEIGRVVAECVEPVCSKRFSP
jgi:hypothetical protein